MKKLIVNADDLGYAIGVNEGIIKAHKDGIVTSTSLMVDGQAVEEGVKLARKYPNLSLGLHFQINKEEWLLIRQLKKAISVVFIEKTKDEFIRQVEAFRHLTGKQPDHIDGHYHVHRLPRLYQFVRAFCKENNIPMRGEINFVSSFFGIPSPEKLTVENFKEILRNLPEGVSEIMCHPGFVTPDLNSSYLKERELELQVLTSPEIRKEIKKLKIKLISWRDYRSDIIGS